MRRAGRGPGDEEVFRALDGLRDSAAVQEARAYARSRAARPRRGGVSAWRRPVLASGWAGAALACAVAAGIFLHPVRTAEFETRTGEVRTATLEDGSVVTLDTNSKIRWTFDGRSRRVQLVRGQVAFQVAHDKRHPFRVTTPAGLAVTAVGTEFDVVALPSRTAVTLLEGRVLVEAARPRLGRPPAPTSLAPGEQLALGADGGLSPKRHVALANVMSWRSARLDLSDLTVAEAITEMNRYSTAKIRLDAPLVAGRRIDGVFRAGDVEALSKALSSYFGLRAERRPGGDIVLSGSEVCLGGVSRCAPA